MDIYKLQLQLYVKRSDVYNTNLQKAYGVFLGQCTTKLRRALESSHEWSRIEEEANVFKLMVAIRQQVRNTITTNHYNTDMLTKAVGEFYQLVQHYNQPDKAYYREFKARYNIVHQNGGLLSAHPILVSEHGEIEGSVFADESGGNEFEGDLESFEAKSYPKMPVGEVPESERGEGAIRVYLIESKSKINKGVMRAKQAYLAVCFL